MKLVKKVGSVHVVVEHAHAWVDFRSTGENEFRFYDQAYSHIPVACS